MCIRKVDVIIIAAMTPKKGLKACVDTRRITPWQDLKQFIHVIAGDLIAISFINFFGMCIFGSDA